MDLTPFKITAEDRKKGVKSAPDTLTGTAQQNKAIFDNFPDGFADKYNLATDALQGFGNVTQSHLDNTANPHKTTKAQVGLGNADNTADANKPVSSPQAAALLKKTDKATQDPINQGFTNDIARLNSEKTDKATQDPMNQGFAADVARLEAGKTDKATQNPINQTVSDALQTLDNGKASTSYVDSRDGKTYQDAKDYADSLAFSAGAVLSVFGRAGAVVAKTGDYTAAMVGAEPTGSAAAAVATHNTAAGTHNDIRNLTTTHNASSTAHTGIRNLTTAHNASLTAHTDIRSLTANHIAATDLHTNALTHSKSGTIHTLSGTIPTAAYYTARFKAAANFVAGDTFKIGTTVYTGTLTNSNDALPDELFLAGKVLTVEVDTAGKKINFKAGGGGKPKPPTAWTFFQAITTSQNWTPPEDGWYRVHVFGQSGSGASGGGGVGTSGSGGGYGGDGGGGGGSGGYSMSDYMMDTNIITPCTCTSSITSFGSQMSATCGTNAAKLNGGIGGFGTGGNAYNFIGANGGKGGNYGYPAKAGENGQNGGGKGGLAGNGNKNGWQGGGGGGGGRLYTNSNNQYVSPIFTNLYSGGNGGDANEYGATNGTVGNKYPLISGVPTLFGGGNGGGGGGAMGAPGNTSGGTGSLGTPAIIIIERGATT